MSPKGQFALLLLVVSTIVGALAQTRNAAPRTDVPLATSTTPGIVKPDNVTTLVDGAGTLSAVQASASLTGMVNVKTYGAICDGGPHPLSSKYSTLSAAQGVYPFITSLGQEIDYAAAKQSANIAFGPDGSEHGVSTGLNLPLVFPAGVCKFGSDTLLVRNADGISISGAGKTATVLQSSNTVLAFDGLWYSAISNMEIAATGAGAIAALDIDGNVPGHPYATRGVQGNNLTNVLISGGHSNYALAMCRQAGSAGQCSENVYVNMHLSQADVAAYFQTGYNAVGNVWMGGDCQDYLTSCVVLQAGSLGIFKVSFESTHGYSQVLNDGWDIDASLAGVGDGIPVYGSRSESLRFYRGGGAQNADIRSFTHNPAGFSSWGASTPFPQYSMLQKSDVNGDQHLYVATSGGTSGGTEPAWPASGSTSDGTVTWTKVSYNVVQIVSGAFDYQTSTINPTASVRVIGGLTAFGTFAPDTSIGWGTFADGSNAATESSVFSQGQSVSIYANPQPSSQTLKSGTILPGASAGMIAKGKLVLGGNSSPQLTCQVDGCTLSAPIWLPSLPTGTPASYACFDAAGKLISSAAPC